MKKITIKDIAREAKVSIATVSRVLNNSGYISDESKKRVLKIKEKYNYTPNIFAQNLSSGLIKNIGVIILESIDNAFLNPYFSEVLRGISAKAQSMEYLISILPYEDSAFASKQIDCLINSNRIDGIILLEIQKNDELVKYLIEKKLPFVLNGRFEKTIENTYSVNTDSVKSAYVMTDYLIKQGHKNIAFINGDKRFIVNSDRELGYKNALKNNNIEIKKEYILYTNNFYEDTYLKIKELLKNYRDITAIFAKDDLKAFYTLKTLNELNIKIPSHITLVGHNNYYINKLLSQSFPTIDVPIFDMGQCLAEMLINILEGNTIENNHVVFDTSLIR